MGAPTWVSYVALCISILALLVAFGSMWILYLNYRSSGPRLRLEISHIPRAGTDPAYPLQFSVVNHGKGDVEIEGFNVVPYGERKSFLEISFATGNPLPFRLSGNQREVWTVDVLESARRYCDGVDKREFRPNSSWPTLIRFGAKLANGKMLRARPQFDARKIISDAHKSSNKPAG